MLKNLSGSLPQYDEVLKNLSTAEEFKHLDNEGVLKNLSTAEKFKHLGGDEVLKNLSTAEKFKQQIGEMLKNLSGGAEKFKHLLEFAINLSDEEISAVNEAILSDEGAEKFKQRCLKI